MIEKLKRLKKNKIIRYVYTFKYIKLLSYISARSLQQKLNQSHKEKYAYYYGFQILYGAINKFLLLMLTGILFQALPQILIVALSFMVLRVYIGGLHFDSYTKCAYISLLCLVSMGLASKYIPYNGIMNLFVFSTVFIITIVRAPVEHKNRPLNNVQKIRFKYIALVLICIIYCLQLIINDTNINNSIMYGVLLAGVIALPLFNNIEKENKFNLNCLK